MNDRAIIESMYCASVVPRRCVGRVRRALAAGRDPEIFLAEIEAGMEEILSLYDLTHEFVTCPSCGKSERVEVRDEA